MDLTSLITQGNANPFVMGGMAFALGALHGLEPGHSKTMIAAFMIAVRGTVGQAVLLGVSAAFSHSLIVWILAYAGLFYGNELIAEDMEGWFMLVSGLIIIILAIWIFWQTRKANINSRPDHSHDHNHDHNHHDHPHSHDHSNMPEDAHARAHAADIEKRFANGKATTGQVILFGLTGGLLPCAAAVTVLIICLHLDKVSLGIGLVAAFSIGLAVVLVAAGVVAALGTFYLTKRYSNFDRLIANAPYLSAIVMVAIGMAMAFSGFAHLPA